MRPRVFPAEDTSRRAAPYGSGAPCFNEAAGIPRGRHELHTRMSTKSCHASMRPRVFPAEDGELLPHERERDRASMRPRVFPAEDAAEAVVQPGQEPASMRPRVFPAEDMSEEATTESESKRFNEAAGIPRGRLSLLPQDLYAHHMRFNEAAGIPRGRLDAAGRLHWSLPSFNEAAGIPRGRHPAQHFTDLLPARFNEAAGIPRGRRRSGDTASAPGIRLQ